MRHHVRRCAGRHRGLNRSGSHRVHDDTRFGQFFADLEQAESARLYGLGSAAEFAHQQPAGRLLAPAGVAAARGWLAGEASSGVSRAVLPVDGGLAL